ncbi:MAG TPA: hypothetical protein VFW71_04640 [Actinomycetota bacterium]|nr:hypothetical protein [Actinomycetota bacterium]
MLGLLAVAFLAVPGVITPPAAALGPPRGPALIPNALRFSVTPTLVAAGAKVTVTSVDPCPAPATTATVGEFPEVFANGIPGPPPASATLTPAQGPIPPAAIPQPAPTQIPLRPDGSWSGTVRLGPQTGSVTVAASCTTGGNPLTGAYANDTLTVRTAGAGYWFGWGDGEVSGAGDAGQAGERISLNAPLVGIAALPTTGAGYWTAGADGGVFAFGEAGFFGSAEPLTLNAPVVGIAPTTDGGGYWLAARDGGVFAFGDAPFLGSDASSPKASPVVGIAETPTGRGYGLAHADGSVSEFGSAPAFRAPAHLNGPIVGIAPTKDGQGYWLAASDGGVFSFGSAAFYGPSTGTRTCACRALLGPPPPPPPVVALAATPG